MEELLKAWIEQLNQHSSYKKQCLFWTANILPTALLTASISKKFEHSFGHFLHLQFHSRPWFHRTQNYSMKLM